MKIVQINLGLYGSTGQIMLAIKKRLEENGDKSILVYPELPINLKKNSDDILIKGTLSRKANHFLEKITGYQGCFSIFKTMWTVHKIYKQKPDIIHLHNIHKMNLNLWIFFRFIKRKNIKVVWTLHDCWAFTGQCPYFTMVKCKKWKKGCYECPQYRKYPATYFDRTNKMWKLKKKWFSEIEKLTIVTPSIWLKKLVQESYLKNYPVKVIYNGIDTKIFRPIKSSFRHKYNIKENEYIVLGVAFDWGPRKGLDVFVKLSQILDEKFKIVLVGTNEKIDKLLPKSIISIHRTQSQEELAKIYTAADVFVNPTREEVLGMVNIEALACGTPVITFNTGGSPECIDYKCGMVIHNEDIEKLINSIIDICEKHIYSETDCIMRASLFNKDDKYDEYINLYHSL